MQNKDHEAQIERIRKLISTAKANWFGLLSYLAFVGVTLLGVEDADFFIPSRQTELPLIGVSVPTALFFYIAPSLGAMIYVCFHLHLMKLWGQLSKAPAHIVGVPLSDHIPPWFLADYALGLRVDGALQRRPLDRLAHHIVSALAFWATPLALAAFWFRSMPKHDPWLTGLAICVPLLLTVYVGKRSHEQLVTLMKPLADIRTVGRFAWLFVAIISLLFGHVSSYGIYANGPRMRALNLSLGLPVSANLEGVNFSQTPDDWQDFDAARDTYRRDWCAHRAISPQACGPADQITSDITNNLEFARGNWCSEFLETGRNCTDYFEGLEQQFPKDWQEFRKHALANLGSVNLSAYDLRNANLSNARLEGANLQEAKLSGANLRDARLEGADLTSARMAFAYLRGAQLKSAQLTAAQLTEANLQFVRLDHADLNGAQLDGANLMFAILNEANLLLASLKGANLRGAYLTGANLSATQVDNRTSLNPVTLLGAALRRVDYANVALEQSQIDKSFGDASVILPQDIKRPPHWPDWELAGKDFDDEWRKWLADPASYIPPEKPS
ncbi:MAG: pentapeptide repeat-containing protein [Litoreibacter sp.]|uniref:pentapeptide repeat-containing protein n=1 Tax=Litoreibacter sp. TaxID=1969459 RepID=UPI003296BBA5